jgi:hypothetical protein
MKYDNYYKEFSMKRFIFALFCWVGLLGSLFAVSDVIQANYKLGGTFTHVAYAENQTNRYAYVGGSAAYINIYDITHPNTPLFINQVKTDGQIVTLIRNDHYLFTAQEGRGLVIFDISNRTKPKKVGSYPVFTYGTYGIAIEGNTAYLAANDHSYGCAVDNNCAKGKIYIIDISDKTHPTLIKMLSFDPYIDGVHVYDHKIYVRAGNDGLKIIDVSDPNNPASLSTVNTTDAAKDVDVFGNYAYVAEGNAGIEIIDISNPSSPFIVASYDTNGSAMDVNYFMNVLFVADGKEGLKIIDVATPTTPTLIGSYDTDGKASHIALSFTQAIVADGSGGLKIIDVSNRAHPALLGAVSTFTKIKDIVFDGDTLYLAADEKGLLIFQTTDIHNPTFIKRIATQSDATRVVKDGTWLLLATDNDIKIIQADSAQNASIRGTIPEADSDDIYLSYPYVYILIDGDMKIYDISNPQSPQLVVAWADDEDDTFTAYYITVANGYAYLTGGDSRMHIVDITEPTSPVLKGIYSSPTQQDSYEFKRVVVKNHYAFIADNDNGLEIVDISNPSSPTYVSNLSLYYVVDYQFGYAKVGVGDITLNNGYIYATQAANGVYIIDISQISAPHIVAHYDTLRAGTIATAENIFITSEKFPYYGIAYSPTLLFDHSFEATLNAGETIYFHYNIAQSGKYAVTLDQLGSDADLYVSSGTIPSTSAYDWISAKSGTAIEAINFNVAQDNTDIYFMIKANGTGHYRITFGSDNDEDGIVDRVDFDDDNDGIGDSYEILCGTDPYNASSKPADLDHDGIPDRYDPDKDGDGIDNATELSVGLNPSDPSDGEADSDGDGFSNAIEVSVGTSYRSASDKPGWAPVAMDELLMFVPFKP